MERTRKFRRIIIAVVICILMATTVWAADQVVVSYSATLNDDVICTNELTAAQTVTLTAKVGKAVSMDAFTAQVTVPEGWKIQEIANSKLNSEGFDFNLANGMILWYSIDGKNVENDLLAEVTVEVPAGTPAGEYEIVFNIIDISRDFGMPWESDKTLTATLTVANHADGDDADHLCDYCGAEMPAEPVTGLKGDVNLDGAVDALDLAIMARVVPGIDNLTNAQAQINADVNDDGQIDAIDLAKFARFVPGIITDWSQD